MNKKLISFFSILVIIITISQEQAIASNTYSAYHKIYPVPHYYQTDPKWGNYLYGGYDPLNKYGCGPTAVSIVVSALTHKTITPPKMAKWSADQNYWVYRSGSLHSLIPNACAAFGLDVEKLYLYDQDSIRNILELDKLIIFLMGPGHFTDQGHYIVVHGMYSDGTIAISDPFSKKNTKKHWKLKTLIHELSKANDNGAPAWVISNSNF